MNEGRTHGPLPALLVGLTAVTGLVDAFSYLSLGHVFVANITRNVVFLGHGLAGVGDVEVVASVVAVLTFAGGGFRRPMGRGARPAPWASADRCRGGPGGPVMAAAVLPGTAGVHGTARHGSTLDLVACSRWRGRLQGRPPVTETAEDGIVTVIR